PKVSSTWRPPELWSAAAADSVRYEHRLEGKPLAGEVVNPYAGRTSSESAVLDGAAVLHFVIDDEDHRRLGVINQTGAFGPFHLENFSLESSLIAMTAVQDALLHAAGDHLVFAGGIPPECDGEFWGLRSPFGELVSGKIEGGKLMSAEVHCERTGPRRLALDTEAADWKVKGTCASQAVVKVDVEAGETFFLKRK
ncbi:MAG: hypothetical protein HY360_13645, partial [Verrucomicrobia bacterium]|nr:hypothetical protein [Verrucomicrobiota bacterium]